MAFRWNTRDHAAQGVYILKWLVLAAPVGSLVGAAVALFLWSLDKATQIRWATDMGSGIPWLLFFLPLIGVGVSAAYHYLGKSAEGGNNLVIEQIHEPGGGVPRRMASLILIGTVLTHLGGGSAGREGTAVQMGGSIASGLARLLKLRDQDIPTILMAGVAAGFGAVFGTPVAGAIFAAEVLTVGVISFEAIIPCFIASVAGDWTTAALGIHHTHYFIGTVGQLSIMAEVPHLNLELLGKVLVASAAFGFASVLFSELAHSLQIACKNMISRPLLRPVLGALIVIGLTYLLGPDYLGLGVSADPNHPDQVTILSSFQDGGATGWSWLWKTIFTTVTLGSGFKGGEVTPLFYIGASLGNAMSALLHAPVGLFAALGFVAVFAGASNTPLACTIMGIELFGGQAELIHSGFTVYVAVACFVSYFISGNSGIYLSQRIPSRNPTEKGSQLPTSLRAVRKQKPALTLPHVFGAPKKHFEILYSAVALYGRKIRVPEARTGGTCGDGIASARHSVSGFEISAQEIGQIRIYMTQADKISAHGMKRWFSKPLYRAIIEAAKKDGLQSANAHHTHYGYSGLGEIQANNLEIPNDKLTLCVELISSRDKLDKFCRNHGNLLKDKVIVYKQLEHWGVEDKTTLKITEEEDSNPNTDAT